MIRNKLSKFASFMLVSFMSVAVSGLFASEAEATEKKIPEGITIGEIEAGGMTQEELLNKANEYIAKYTNQLITLKVDGNSVSTTAANLGYYWKNTDIISKAGSYCQEGNVISRYKESKDLMHDGGVKFDFEMDVNDDVMRETLDGVAAMYNVPHVDAKLTRTGGTFSVTPESDGKVIDVDSAITGIHNYLANDWDGKEWSDTLNFVVDKATCTAQDCAQVKDLLGSFSTRFSTSSANYSRNKNLENGMRLLDGITIPVGDTISVNSFLEPWTSSNGWYAGGTYVNGRVEDTLGGGICQVSSTLYNAALNAEIEVVERYNHSMTVGYVPLSMDAALAGTWKDLKLKNNTNAPLYIEAIYTNGRITFNIYGVETRSSNRSVQYVSQKTSSSSGYSYKLLKRVYVDGALQSEDVVNTSNYKNGGGSTGSRTAITGYNPSAPEPVTEPVPEPETTTVPETTQPPAETQPAETAPPETEAPTTQPPTEPATEPATQPPTQAPTEPPAEQQTTAPVQ